MQIEYRSFDTTRMFGVELEVERTCTKKELAETLEYHELTRNSIEKRREVRIEGKETLKKWAESNGNAYWHVKYDSTCGALGYKNDEGGWEIASYVASGNDDIESIALAGETLGVDGATVNKNCGLHIHANVADFNISQIGVLLAYWLKIESFIFQASPVHRRNNKYCKSMRTILEDYYKNHPVEIEQTAKDIEVINDFVVDEKPIEEDVLNSELAIALKKLFEAMGTLKPTSPVAPKKRTDLTVPANLWEIMKPNDLRVHENSDKKVSLNTVGFAKLVKDGDSSRITVELRVPECLLSKDHIEHWTRLFVNFVETCKNRSMPSNLEEATSIQEVLSILGLDKEESVVILSQELYRTKLWFLRRLIEFTEIEKIAIDAKEHVDAITLIE